MLVSIEGKSESKCEGSWVLVGDRANEFKITMDLQQLDTGIPLRNKHLRENYLHTEKFPTATLTEMDATNIDAQMKGTASGKSPFKAVLELHGVKKPIEGEYQIKDGKKYSGSFRIDLPDFDVERPSFMGVKVVDNVFITFAFEGE